MTALAFPDYDRHFARQDGYQAGIIDAALPWCRKKDLAIDVGAHVGLITRKMLKEGFKDIVCFEPDGRNYQCLRENVDLYRCIVLRAAVSDCDRRYYSMQNPAPENSGAWEVAFVGDRPKVDPGNRTVTLDALGYAPDLIKYDIQGHELRALKGSVETLKTHKPVVICECWRDGKRDNGPREFLEDFGYVCVETVGKDLIFAWPEAA